MAEKKKLFVRVGKPYVTTVNNGEKVVRIAEAVTLHPEGELYYVCEELERLRLEHQSEYSDLTLRLVQDCLCISYCSCTPNYHLYGWRLESDQEFALRTEQEQKIADDTKARELQILADLKKKYDS